MTGKLYYYEETSYNFKILNYELRTKWHRMGNLRQISNSGLKPIDWKY